MKQYVRGILVYHNKFLVIKEYKSQDYNVWNFPGGKVGENESLEDCCRREMAEEVNLDIISATLLYKNTFTFANAGTWLGHYFLCTPTSYATFKINEPTLCDGYCWLSLAEIKNLPNLGIPHDVIQKLENTCLLSKNKV